MPAHLCLVVPPLRTSSESPTGSAYEPQKFVRSDLLSDSDQDTLMCEMLTPLYASSCKRLHSCAAALFSALGASSWHFAACLGGIFQYTLSLKDARMLAGRDAGIGNTGWNCIAH